MIYRFRSALKNKVKAIYKNVYKIKIKNILFIFFASIICTIIFEMFRYIILDLLNAHLNIILNIDYLTIYSCILRLVLPLDIVLVEKINSKQDYIVVETYLKNTMMILKLK